MKIIKLIEIDENGEKVIHSFQTKGLIGYKLWSVEDVEDQAFQDPYFDGDINTVLKILGNRLNECTDDDWAIIHNAIDEAKN